MKKSTKIILIIATVLILVGGIVALICLMLGASLNDVHIEVKNPIKIEWQDRIDLSDVMDGSENHEDLDTWNFAGEEIHSLDLDIEAGTLYIQNGDSYGVAVQNGRHGLRCEVKNGVLRVKETDSIYTLLDWSGKSIPIITVVIPEGVTVDTVHVTVGAGNVQARSLLTRSIDIEVDAGNFACQQLQVQGRCQIDVDAGNVSIADGQIQGGLQVDVDAGMVSYIGALDGDWQLDVDAGNAELTLDADLEDYNYQIDYDLGNIYLGDREYTGMSDEVHLDHGARYRAQIQCDVGRVDVSFSQ